MASMLQCLNGFWREHFIDEAKRSFRTMHNREITPAEEMMWFETYFCQGKVWQPAWVATTATTDVSSQTTGQTASCNGEENLMDSDKQVNTDFSVQPKYYVHLRNLCRFVEVRTFLDHLGVGRLENLSHVEKFALDLGDLMRTLDRERLEAKARPKKESSKEPLSKLSRNQAKRQHQTIEANRNFLRNLGKACSTALKGIAKEDSLMRCAFRDFIMKLLLFRVDLKSKSGVMKVLEHMFGDHKSESLVHSCFLKSLWNLKERKVPQALRLMQDVRPKPRGGRKHKKGEQGQQKEGDTKNSFDEATQLDDAGHWEV